MYTMYGCRMYTLDERIEGERVCELESFGELGALGDEDFSIGLGLLHLYRILFGQEQTGVESRGCLLATAFLRQCRERRVGVVDRLLSSMRKTCCVRLVHRRFSNSSDNSPDCWSVIEFVA